MIAKRFSILLIMVLVLSCFTSCGTKEDNKSIWDKKALAMRDAFLEKVDPDFAYDIALELSETTDLQSSSLGSRTAGSDGEHATADYLAEKMKDIKLSDVELVPISVDKWQFSDATLTIDGIGKAIKPHSYAAASTPAGGVNAEIVYGGDGTMKNYETLDVKGKIVLVEIDQRNPWRITYPMLEAQYHGAAAILISNIDDSSKENKDVLNIGELGGPIGIPCVSISQNDSEMIQNKLQDGSVNATLTVNNTVEKGGTSYNVIGKIKGNGKSDQLIGIGAHYDMYFKGFQDDSSGAGAVLAMAKALIDSGYRPNNDIVFILHGADEWGAAGTAFDWGIGSWNMINKIHPEWAGKMLTYINLEMPAYEFADYTNMYSAPELYSNISRFINKSPFNVIPDDCFPKGVKTGGYQTDTHSGDFSYYAAGVPSIVNGYLFQRDMKTPYDFNVKKYHSQLDDSSTYNEKVMTFHLKLYGSYLIYTDQTPALPLNFTSQYNRILASLDIDTMNGAEADVDTLKDSLSTLKKTADANYKAAVQLNETYAKLRNQNPSDSELSALQQQAYAMNANNLKAFQYAQDQLLGLMYDKPIVPHEAPQSNIIFMKNTINALKSGDVVSATDEYAWQINNGLERYNLHFSPAVVDIQNRMLFGSGNHFWATDKMFTPADVADATRLLIENYDVANADMTPCIAIYENAINDQQKILRNLVEEENTAIQTLTTMLRTDGGTES